MVVVPSPIRTFGSEVDNSAVNISLFPLLLVISIGTVAEATPGTNVKVITVVV